MELLRGDAYLGTEAKLGTIGEGGGDVGIHTGGIDRELEAADGFGIVAHDALAMARAVLGDVVQGLVEAAHGADTHLVVEELGAEMLFARHAEQVAGIVGAERLVGLLIGIEDDILCCQGGAERGEVGQTGTVDDEAVEGIAHAHTAGLGILDDGGSLCQVALRIEVGVADAGTGLDDGHAGIVAHIVDEGTAATGDDEVDLTHGTEQTGRGLAMGREEGAHGGVDAMGGEHAMDDVYNLAVGALGIGASLEQAHVATLDAEGKHVGRDVGACLVDDADDTEGHAHLADGHPIGTLGRAIGDAERRGQRGYVLHVGGDAVDALLGEQQAVILGIGGIHALKVEAVGLEDSGMVGTQGRCRIDEQGIDGSIGKNGQGGCRLVGALDEVCGGHFE